MSARGEVRNESRVIIMIVVIAFESISSNDSITCGTNSMVIVMIIIMIMLVMVIIAFENIIS